MSCEWQERVAEAMDSDWTPEVQRHAAACPECRDLLADRDLLRRLPPLPESAIAAVRANVNRRLSRSRGFRWQLAAAAAIAFVMLAVAVWVQRSLPAVEPLNIAVAAPAAPMLAAREPEAVSPVRRVRPQPRVAEASADWSRLAAALMEALGQENAAPVAADGPALVALQTEDPDVLIVLIPEAKGDGSDE